MVIHISDFVEIFKTGVVSKPPPDDSNDGDGDDAKSDDEPASGGTSRGVIRIPAVSVLSRKGLADHLSILERLASGGDNSEPRVPIYDKTSSSSANRVRCDEISGAAHFGRMISLTTSWNPDLFLSNVSESLRSTIKTGFTIHGRERGSVTTGAKYKSLNGRWFTPRIVPISDVSSEDVLFRNVVFKWKPSGSGPYIAHYYRVLTVSTKSSRKYVICLEAPRSKRTKVLAQCLDHDQISGFFQVSARFNTSCVEHDYIQINGDEIKDIVGVIGDAK